jgi:hypothetical protein
MPELPVIQNLNPTVFKTTTSAEMRFRRPAFRGIAFHSSGQGFDPHRPYHPIRLKQNPLTRVRFLEYLWCTLHISLDTTRSPQATSANLDLSGSLNFPDRAREVEFITNGEN